MRLLPTVTGHYLVQGQAHHMPPPGTAWSTQHMSSPQMQYHSQQQQDFPIIRHQPSSSFSQLSQPPAPAYSFYPPGHEPSSGIQLLEPPSSIPSQTSSSSSSSSPRLDLQVPLTPYLAYRSPSDELPPPPPTRLAYRSYHSFPPAPRSQTSSSVPPGHPQQQQQQQQQQPYGQYFTHSTPHPSSQYRVMTGSNPLPPEANSKGINEGNLLGTAAHPVEIGTIDSKRHLPSGVLELPGEWYHAELE
ncbi:hypothetical protein B0T24DRAFT_610825 [Lasiosphaeria ovina]|uniref:Uncharacterized protein n=1 Tax=Lasiosphaeria ovina TaxID=92902 RepID=A0AAE0KMD9_9PEZI|nr:hypothetical protein B0T24DRAFT_610825 [Lasiosphaeria ovina]